MKQIKYIDIPQLYFKLMWFFALFLYILIPLQSDLTGLAYKGIVAVTFGCLLLSLLASAIEDSESRLDSVAFIILFLMTTVIFVSLLQGNGEITFDNQIMGILGFIEMPIAIILMNCVRYDEENFRFVFRINILIALVFIVLSFSKYAYSGILDSLYLGYSNPNATGIYLLLNQAILIMNLSALDKLIEKLLVMLLCLYEVYLIYLTNSRTCLLVSLVIMLYYLLGKNFKVPKLIILATILFPLAFLFIYTALYKSGKYTDLVILGKEFYSGREKYYSEQLTLLSGKFAFGDVRLNYFQNMHNGSLAIIASCGVIGYILYFIFYFRTISHYYKNANSKLQNIALIAVLGIFIHSCAEAALIVGGAHYSIIVATFYWILKGKTNEYDS